MEGWWILLCSIINSAGGVWPKTSGGTTSINCFHPPQLFFSKTFTMIAILLELQSPTFSSLSLRISCIANPQKYVQDWNYISSKMGNFDEKSTGFNCLENEVNLQGAAKTRLINGLLWPGSWIRKSPFQLFRPRNELKFDLPQKRQNLQKCKQKIGRK